MQNFYTPRRGRTLACLLLSGGLLAGGARPAAAQGWTGLAHSNYGGTNVAYQNPSAIADGRHRGYLNVAGANLNFYNTYLQLNLPRRPWEDGATFGRENLVEQGGAGTRFASITAEGRLPSLALSLGPRTAVAFTNRLRAFAQLSNVSDNLARLARYGLSEAERLGLANKLLEDNSFNLDLNAYHEFAFTFARVFTPNTTHFFKGGLTAKYLVGLGGGYLLNDGTKYQVYGRDSIQLQSRQLSYGLTDYKIYGQPGVSVGSLYGAEQLGRGFGADLGFTYEWRPNYEKYQYRMDGRDWTDNSRNKYRLRLALALTDLGAIRYGNEQRVRQGQLANNRTVQLGQLDTLRFSSLESVGATARQLTGLSSEGRQFTTYLPAAVRLAADYRLINHLYAGLLWTQNLLPTRTIGTRTISALALTPRIEFSHLEVATPFILANNYRKLQVGAMVRLGPLVVGSDNLGGLFGITTTTGADFYFGLGLALHRRRHRDRDGDQVSNKLDKCPKEKGSWATKGCASAVAMPLPRLTPEAAPATKPAPAPGPAPAKTASATSPPPVVAPASATDSVPGPTLGPVSDSAAPAASPATGPVPAPTLRPTATDQDGDGVPDADDACPLQPGTAATKGCPTA